MSRDRNAVHFTQIVKFLYSYGGRILPRRSDGTLRNIGSFTRVLSVDRSISFSELMVIEEYDRVSALTKKEMKNYGIIISNQFAEKRVKSVFANVLLRFSGVELEPWKSRQLQFASVVCGGA